ncbi:gene transfer agent family protein [Labrys sp. (in: a-proteobacteria)]|uniref:gene transfer agent family protein n=1 Tax=Labrys sp. (in: a-proteobacteria) TaxID=1917972 RepID=UPI0039E25EFF
MSFDWADGTYPFALRLGQIEELQERADCGPLALFERLNNGSWRAGDLRETIRLGLIGGGCEPVKALGLVRRYVDARPLMESLMPARAILAAALWGVEDDQPKKSRRARKRRPRPDETESSASPNSTEPAP